MDSRVVTGERKRNTAIFKYNYRLWRKCGSMFLLHANEDIYSNTAGHVISLFVDTSIPGDASFGTEKVKAFAMIEPDRFELVSDFM